LSGSSIACRPDGVEAGLLLVAEAAQSMLVRSTKWSWLKAWASWRWRLFGLGTKALPSWDSKTRWNNLLGGLAEAGPSGSRGTSFHR